MTIVQLPSRSRAPSGELVDSFHRVHRDLRISLTDRCSLRCIYCMPEQGFEWLAKSSILSTAEIIRVARVATSLGITTFRLTGGEPLLRPDIAEIVAKLAKLRTPDGLPVEVAMTTNGIRLPKLLPDLLHAGLRRVNISLDTLIPERFHTLTRRNRLADVLLGIEAVYQAHLRPLKLNTVVMRGINDDEIVDLVEFAASLDAELRFIEQMPLDLGHSWDRDNMVTREEILAQLRRRWELIPIPGRGGAPAERWKIVGQKQSVGIIASVTAPFCGNCDRLRLTADGQLRNCLFSVEEYDLLPLLRGGATEAEVGELFRECIWGKRAGHGINNPDFLQPVRGMNAIGG